jgi:hypothetical protein
MAELAGILLNVSDRVFHLMGVRRWSIGEQEELLLRLAGLKN